MNKHVGGLIFFSRNFESFNQITNLVHEIRNIKENIIIAVDQRAVEFNALIKSLQKYLQCKK